MVRKRVDERVRKLIEEGVQLEQRSLMVLVGDHGKDQVVNLHQMLSKARVRARPSVLWCYKKELGFSTHKKKRMRAIKKAVSRGLHDAVSDEPFELFISQTDIRWCYYRDTAKILGQTYGVVVLQDFEAITPNLLARTIETVEGGGLVIILLRTVASLKQLYTMSMDVHARYRTGAAGHTVVPRFNERFILSLADCERCLVLDDELNVLPLSSKHIERFALDGSGRTQAALMSSKAKEAAEIAALAESLREATPAGELVALTRTLDQARAVLSFIDALAERRSRSVAALTAPRGRGKSAALGLCLAAAVSTGYSSIFVTAPAPENVRTVFEFLLKGLAALKYEEHTDYDVLKSAHQTSDGATTPVRVNIYQKRGGAGGATTRQVVQYVSPDAREKIAHAELLVIDEAAALPLPTVHALLGPYVCFLASTVTGYEGTGRALQLKLIASLREQHATRAVAESAQAAADGVKGDANGKKGELKLHEDRWAKASAAAKAGAAAHSGNSRASTLRELSLSTPIRYAQGDAVEAWLHRALCLDQHDAKAHALRGGHPAPAQCALYEVDRDALFSYHKLSEAFLQRIMALYSAAHYKNSPNDLQLLSDAPAHRLYVLLGPQAAPADGAAPALPDVLVVIQVALEGKISADVVRAALANGQRAAGDLVPWTLAQQFCDDDFAKLSGARIVRVATHPDAQRMGYGAKALDLLLKYYQGDLDEKTGSESESEEDDEEDAEEKEGKEESDDEPGQLLEETLQPRSALPPLLAPAGSKAAPKLDWVGASFGLTEGLYDYWARSGLKPVYLRQTVNEITGEHTVIMLREVRHHADMVDVGARTTAGWLDGFVADARRRFSSLLAAPCFNHLELSLCLGILGARDETSALAKLCGRGDVDAPASSVEISYFFSPHDLKRLELYSKNLVDHHLITDLVPRLGGLAFEGKIAQCKLSTLQAAILLGLSLQRREVDSVALELGLPAPQALALYNKTMRKFSAALRDVRARHVEANELSLDRAAARTKAHKAAKETNVPHSTPLGAEQAAAAAKYDRNDVHTYNDDDFEIDDSKLALLERSVDAAALEAGALVQLPNADKRPAKRTTDDDGGFKSKKPKPGQGGNDAKKMKKRRS